MGSAEQVKGHVYLSQGKVLSQRAKQDLLAGQLQEADSEVGPRRRSGD